MVYNIKGMINAEDLIKYAKKTLKNQQFIVAIQREPYIHENTTDGIKLKKAAGGAHLLLDGILKQIGGVMVALGMGSADKKMVDEHNRYKVTTTDKNYLLKRIFLKKKEIDGFYYGFANQTLWPLCHNVFQKPSFVQEWWDEYVKVNEKFTKSISEEIGENAFVWINDYHLALLPKMLRDIRPSVKIGTFWHIPWPTYEIFRICPWRKGILEGLLGSNFIGFHRGYHVDNFIECARRELGVIVETEPRSVTYKDHTTKLSNLPAGIDYHEIAEKLEKHKNPSKQVIKNDFGFDYEFLIVGVDRIDYTKGLVERLKALDKFLEKYPQFQGKVVYLSIGAPSRTRIPAYKALQHEITDLVEKINWKYSTEDWKPICFADKVIARERIFEYYQLADACLVTSLDDGMNLVAKEYVICNKADKGMLILSKFTGAAKDLQSSIQINPYDIDQTAEAIYTALTMSPEEKTQRNKLMKSIVKEYNIYNWAIKFIQKTVENY